MLQELQRFDDARTLLEESLSIQTVRAHNVLQVQPGSAMQGVDRIQAGSHTVLCAALDRCA